MKLRFNGTEKVIYWGRAKQVYRFSPDGECPDELGKSILESATLKRQFKFIDPKLTCSICGKEFDKPKAIQMHKNIKHKEKHDEKVIGVDDSSCGSGDRDGRTGDSRPERECVQSSEGILP